MRTNWYTRLRSKALTALALAISSQATLPTVFAQDAAPASKVGDLISEVVSAETEIQVPLRRAKIIRTKKDVIRTAVADPTIVEFVAFGPREVSFIGKTTGSTTVAIWLGDKENSQVLSLLVTVTKDDAVDDQRRMEYGELNVMVNELFPNSRIQLIPVADKLIVRGEARDEEEAVKIIGLLTDRASVGSNSQSNPFNAGDAARPFPEASDLTQTQVINMLKVPGVKQVMLKVRIAELKRSASRDLGADFDFNIKEFMVKSTLAGGGNLMASGTFKDGSFNLVLKALVKNGSAKILAEPNLVTLSGKPATFLAGGEFAVPTVVGVGGAQAATTSFKGFGTSISFTPIVLDKDRVRLEVQPTFSTLNRTNAVNGVFGTDTRTVTTTVEMREGQVLAIAGLLQEQQRGDSTRLPLVGDVPWLNVLTSSKTIARDETELLILVTPELVHPLEPNQAPTILPGMEVTEPHDLDFFIYGDIEGRPDCHHRSTVWPLYKSRLKRCQDVEAQSKSSNYFFSGKHGFSD